MSGGRPVRDVTVFASLYLLLSLPPFLALNPDLSGTVVRVAVVAALGTGLLVAISGLFLAREGVDRFTQFLVAPTDALSVVVDLAFLLAAVAWWLVPELAVRYELGLELETLLVAVLVCHVPMVLVLSLLTAIGKTQS